METSIGELTHLLEVLYSNINYGIINTTLIRKVEAKISELIILQQDEDNQTNL